MVERYRYLFLPFCHSRSVTYGRLFVIATKPAGEGSNPLLN